MFYCPHIPVSSAESTTYTLGIGTRALTVSSPLGTNICALKCTIAYHYNLSFLIPLIPITAEMAGAIWNERFARHFYT